MVEGLGVKTLKVEEDVRVVREEVHGMEGKLEERMQPVEKNLEEVKILLEELVSFSTYHHECSHALNDQGEYGISLHIYMHLFDVRFLHYFTAHMKCWNKSTNPILNFYAYFQCTYMNCPSQYILLHTSILCTQLAFFKYLSLL